jgi:hypothetical protein
VPITELAKAVVSQPGFQFQSQQPPDLSEKVTLPDITDGEAFRKNKYFIENPNALRIVLFSVFN